MNLQFSHNTFFYRMKRRSRSTPRLDNVIRTSNSVENSFCELKRRECGCVWRCQERFNNKSK